MMFFSDTKGKHSLGAMFTLLVKKYLLIDNDLISKIKAMNVLVAMLL